MALRIRSCYGFDRVRPEDRLEYLRNLVRLKWQGRVKHPICRRFYRDEGEDPGRTRLVAGTARSGTTWLADLIAATASYRLIFEPFSPSLVPEYSGFNYFQYARQQENADELARFCRLLFSGRIRNGWVDGHVGRLFPRYRLVKAVRANLMLGWLQRRFPEVPLFLIVRHPCGVVRSRMKLGWATDDDLAPMLSQPDLVVDFLSERADLIDACRTVEEKHALIWCIHNWVPIRQLGEDGITIVFYEELCARPETEMRRVWKRLGVKPPRAVDWTRPSRTTKRSSPAMIGADTSRTWREELSDVQIRRVLAVVEQFGLGGLYGKDGRPRRAWLASHV